MRKQLEKSTLLFEDVAKSSAISFWKIGCHTEKAIAIKLMCNATKAKGGCSDRRV